jgi:hypothetical protein
MSFRRIHPSPGPCVTFQNKVFFYGEELLATHPTPELEGDLFSDIHD